MASNDPGWGSRNNNDGPPDLDEMLRQFSRKLNGRLRGSWSFADSEDRLSHFGQ